MKRECSEDLRFAARNASATATRASPAASRRADERRTSDFDRDHDHDRDDSPILIERQGAIFSQRSAKPSDSAARFYFGGSLGQSFSVHVHSPFWQMHVLHPSAAGAVAPFWHFPPG
jgi:hypothetical protein